MGEAFLYGQNGGGSQKSEKLTNNTAAAGTGEHPYTSTTPKTHTFTETVKYITFGLGSSSYRVRYVINVTGEWYFTDPGGVGNESKRFYTAVDIADISNFTIAGINFLVSKDKKTLTINNPNGSWLCYSVFV